jgi:hypothetical protein
VARVSRPYREAGAPSLGASHPNPLPSGERERAELVDGAEIQEQSCAVRDRRYVLPLQVLPDQMPPLIVRPMPPISCWESGTLWAVVLAPVPVLWLPNGVSRL